MKTWQAGKILLQKTSNPEAKKAWRPLAFLYPLSQHSSPHAVVGPCVLLLWLNTFTLSSLCFTASSLALPTSFAWVIFQYLSFVAACFSFSWLFVSELSQMFITELRCPLLSACFLLQGSGMSLYSEEVVPEMLPSHGYGNRGCCWHARLVHPCSWVRDYQRALFLSGLSNSSIKKAISWIACTMACCPSSRFWGIWISLR